MNKQVVLVTLVSLLLFGCKMDNSKSSIKTMADFGVRATNLFFYYNDLQAAGKFYSETLGMELVADYKTALILRMTADSYLILVDAAWGMHSSDEPKTVALALLTDQLDEWYAYLKGEEVEIKYDYKPKDGGPHDGFVIVDPEGYLLEFETFKQHPENEKFIPLLNGNIEKLAKTGAGNTLHARFNIHSTITWLYYNDVLAMQNFYKDVLGLDLVADQGWTKIYKVTETGFMAIVDGKKGMHSATKEKAVNVGFILDDLDPWFEYIKENTLMELHQKEIKTGSDNRYRAFVSYCPEDYYLEFDRFYPHTDNNRLLEYLDIKE